ncbi:hypothetical protein [Haladaptatus sp. AB643]|uniref:hypothetical protein n=1 Tax=Haladaptatus sp. AB643 TaxID=2934174 RepID=UPI00209BE5CF|nr:hypothetical protein [Haladaptatus sp. AB643]MCO8246336.1 hypothetical protein [Haladaptatus sp. AB643]
MELEGGKDGQGESELLISKNSGNGGVGGVGRGRAFSITKDRDDNPPLDEVFGFSS